jgi:hypothetical protein
MDFVSTFTDGFSTNSSNQPIAKSWTKVNSFIAKGKKSSREVWKSPFSSPWNEFMILLYQTAHLNGLTFSKEKLKDRKSATFREMKCSSEKGSKICWKSTPIAFKVLDLMARQESRKKDTSYITLLLHFSDTH